MTARGMGFVAAVCMAVVAYGQDTRKYIYQHNSQLTPEVNYHIDQFPWYNVAIWLGVQDQTFEFEACEEHWDGQQWVYDAPAEINYIRALENAGPVTLTVVGHNGHPYGASRLGQIYISDLPGVTGTITAANISGTFNDLGASTTDYLGALHVGGDFYASSILYVYHAVQGPITIEGAFNGQLDCGYLLDFTAASAGAYSAITINASYWNWLTIQGGSGAEALIGGALRRLGPADGIVRAPDSLERAGRAGRENLGTKTELRVTVARRSRSIG